MLTENAFEILDGLMLGGGRVQIQRSQPHFTLSTLHLEWAQTVEDALRRIGVQTTICRAQSKVRCFHLKSHTYAELEYQRRRWALPKAQPKQRQIPRDVRLTPTVLAYWYAGRGECASNGYAIHLATRDRMH